ncbi:MAG: XRE family transcriptional regulator [Clostridia bacterium]|nr:XRE family transcriptional regulator [Clostridia bacterium]
MKGKFTEFGKKIKFALIMRDLTQDWLISEVKKKTGLYFDSSYLNKIMTGKNENDKVLTAIKEILELE